MRNIIAAFFVLGFALHAMADQKLKNGAPFFGVRDADLPRDIYILSFAGGPAVLPPEQQGTIQILKEMLKDGPSTLAFKDFKDQLFKYGAEIDSSAGSNAFQVVVRTPPNEQSKVLGLLKQTLESPRISKEDYERYHARVMAGLKSSFEDMRNVTFYFAARDVMSYAPQVRNGDTSPSSFEKLSYEQFKENVGKVLDFTRMFVSYAGPEAEASAKSNFESTFADLLKTPYVRWKPSDVDVPKIEKRRYTIIDKPGATDNQILFIFPQSLKRDKPAWLDGQVVMDLLGGGLHGRLGDTLRTKRGLTYTAASGFNSSNLPYWLAWTFGGVEQTKGLIEGVPEVIDAFKAAKLSAGEVSESKERILNEYKSRTELASDRISEKGWYYRNGLDASFADRYSKEVERVNAARANTLRSRLQNQNAAVYMMGDKEVLLKILESAGVKRDSVRVVNIADIP